MKTVGEVKQTGALCLRFAYLGMPVGNAFCDNPAAVHERQEEKSLEEMTFKNLNMKNKNIKNALIK